jgi:hypothetical protein
MEETSRGVVALVDGTLRSCLIGSGQRYVDPDLLFNLSQQTLSFNTEQLDLGMFSDDRVSLDAKRRLVRSIYRNSREGAYPQVAFGVRVSTLEDRIQLNLFKDKNSYYLPRDTSCRSGIVMDIYLDQVDHNTVRSITNAVSFGVERHLDPSLVIDLSQLKETCVSLDTIIKTAYTEGARRFVFADANDTCDTQALHDIFDIFSALAPEAYIQYRGLGPNAVEKSLVAARIGFNSVYVVALPHQLNGYAVNKYDSHAVAAPRIPVERALSKAGLREPRVTILPASINQEMRYFSDLRRVLHIS